jgi:hypothetical protein
MNKKHFNYQFEEDLIRMAADSPRPSAGLRLRVMVAAERAARRRLRIRRTVAAALTCLLLVGTVLWEGAADRAANGADSENVAESGLSEIFSAQRRVAVCCLGEWPHVEWFVRLREAQCQILRGTH